MRIALVAHRAWPRHQAGVESYVGRMAEALAAVGEQVLVVATDDDRVDRRGVPRRLMDAPYESICVGDDRVATSWPESWDRPDITARVLDVVRGWQPDVVHWHHLMYVGGEGLAALAREGFPTVFTAHDFWLLCPRKGQLRMADGAQCSGPEPAKCVACLRSHRPGRSQGEAAVIGALGRVIENPLVPLKRVSSWLRPRRSGPADGPNPRWIEHRLRAAAHAQASANLVIAPSLLLRDRCSAAGLATEDWVVHACGVDRALMALPRPRFTAPLRLGFFGSLVPEKGAEVLLMALSALPADAVRVVLRGPKGADPAYEAKLRRLARGRADVHFGGPFRPAELPQAMAEIDVLIVPSLWLENAPFVILEARAAGRPVIASDLGGMRELVRVGVDGFTFPAGDAVALAARLAAFVAAPASLRELSPRPSPSIDEDAAFHRTQYAALLARRTW